MATYLTLTSTTSKYLKALPKFDESSLDYKALRARPDIYSPVPIPVVDTETINVPASEGNIVVDVYRPRNSQDKILPALVFIHGGGWALHPCKSSYKYFCSKLAEIVKCAVYYVHYTLSPEARFPLAIEECFDVLSWVSNNSEELNVDSTRIAIGGDSAGGNIAIGVTLLDKERNIESKLVYQVLLYPVTNAVLNTSSYYEFGKDFGLTRKAMEYYWDLYVDKTERQNILACPLKATVDELRGLPPAFIITAEADILRDEGEVFARQLTKADVPVTSTRILGVLHGFVTNPMLYSNESLTAIDLTAGALGRAFA